MNGIALTDSHCHLMSIRGRGYDLEGVVERFRSEGGAWLLDVGVRVDDWSERRLLASLHFNLRFSCGVHPSEAGSSEHPDWDQLNRQLEDPLCVAVGEIGLDWFRGRDFEERQYEFFRTQLDVAEERDLPVILHVREAMPDVLKELKARAGRIRGVFHCFSGGVEEAREALNLGFFISFAGNLTYRDSRKLHEAAAFVPEDGLLVETDAPYLTPVPLRGRSNEPAFSAHTLTFMAQLRAADPQRLSETTTRNFERVFRP